MWIVVWKNLTASPHGEKGMFRQGFNPCYPQAILGVIAPGNPQIHTANKSNNSFSKRILF
jgi:hypothetical protein